MKAGGPDRIEVVLQGSLPSATRSWDDARALGLALLERHPGRSACTVRITANRRSVLWWRRSADHLLLSVHWALAPHADEVLRVVERDPAAWARLRAHLPERPPSPARTEPAGRVHDLAALTALERQRLPDLPEVPVTWGRWSGRPARRSLRLGSCEPGPSPLIRIHPVLDHADVPGWFVGFVLFHELLHVVHPPIEREGRRLVHPPAFRAAERRHPHHSDAHAWELKNLDALLRRTRAPRP